MALQGLCLSASAGSLATAYIYIVPSVNVLLIALVPEQHQENAWSLNGTIKVFTGYIRKLIYIPTDFQVPEGLP